MASLPSSRHHDVASHHGELIVAGPSVLRPSGPARPALVPRQGGGENR